MLDYPHSSEVKEQALCIIGNIASASISTDYIMEDESILKKLLEFVVSNLLLHTIVLPISFTYRSHNHLRIFTRSASRPRLSHFIIPSTNFRSFRIYRNILIAFWYDRDVIRIYYTLLPFLQLSLENSCLNRIKQKPLTLMLDRYPILNTQR